MKKYSQEVADFSRDFAESVERHIDTVAASIRQTLQTTPWIPESIRPPAPPVRRTAPKLSLSYLDRVQNWVSRNPAVTAAVIAFLSTGTFIIWRRRKLSRQKRRARRAANGARTEVVILAGSPHSPLTKSIALDLERRGFIVYIPVSTLAEEQTVHSELRADIHPLNIDITSVSFTYSKFSVVPASNMTDLVFRISQSPPLILSTNSPRLLSTPHATVTHHPTPSTYPLSSSFPPTHPLTLQIQ